MLNLNFVNKVPKIAKDNEIILLTQKVKRSKEIKELTKSYYSTRSKKIINLVEQLETKANIKLTLAQCLILKEKDHIIIKKHKKS